MVPALSRLGAGWMILAAASFALMSACAKLGAADFNSVELLFWRTSIGAVLLGLPMMLRGHSPATPHWRAHIHRGFVGYASMAALFYALTRLSLPTAVTLNYTSSLFFSALCIVKLKDRPRPRVWLALSLGFFGVVLLLRPTFTPQQWLPGLIGLVSGISAGFAVFQVRELGQMGEQPWRVVFWFFCLSSVIGLVWLLLGPGFSAVTPANVWPLLGVGVFGMLGQLAMTRAYKEGRRYLVASFAYLTVVFSALLGVALWDDVLSVASLLAMGLIVSAGMLAARA
ncbi:Permease of the drug/metabolite transporter (DMT) superfamily [Chromobacterium violaceum]|nr:DMT family transporter [Chromobacterium violaceum]KJH68224.1 membrane protein [Chromobacterium violaceum]MBA8737218.1 DMT family transporter [Chromobacterium violaceum]MBP4047114.1 DMT family transporter [Chromobacterium violaceum]MBT2869698.1 DMT family transporter [Chromobacterium violaceum]SUX88635.1 Predicted permease, DMT superfamily [Chromobacterium violaceum]